MNTRILLGILLMCGSAGANEPVEENSAPEMEEVTYLGVHASPITPVLTSQLGLEADVGLVVDQVDPGSPAEKAGIKPYDILLKLDDQILIGNKQFTTLVRNRDSGDEIRVSYLRTGQEGSLEATLGKRSLRKASAVRWIGKEAFKMPGPHLFQFREESDLPHVDHQAMADWSARLGENVEMVIENVYRGAQHPDFENMPRVYLKRGNKMLQFKDDDASYDFSVSDGVKLLKIRNDSGESLFEGKLETEEDLKNIPEQYRDRADLMLKMEKRVEREPTEL